MVSTCHMVLMHITQDSLPHTSPSPESSSPCTSKSPPFVMPRVTVVQWLLSLWRALKRRVWVQSLTFGIFVGAIAGVLAWIMVRIGQATHNSSGRIADAAGAQSGVCIRFDLASKVLSLTTYFRLSFWAMSTISTFRPDR